VTAGISIELLQQADRTQMGLATSAMEQGAMDLAQTCIEFYAQNAQGAMPRLMGVDDTGNAAKAQYQAQTFRALTGGGSCEVQVAAGSAIPKTPAGRNQEILQYYQAGLFGQPGSPQAAMIAVREMNLSRSDRILEDLQAEYQRQQAIQEQQMQAHQSQMMMQQQAAQAQQAQTQQQSQIDAQTAQAKISADAQKTAAQHAHDLQMAQMEVSGDLTREAAIAAREAQQKRMDAMMQMVKTNPMFAAQEGSLPASAPQSTDMGGLNNG
jgi:hypothetical protein